MSQSDQPFFVYVVSFAPTGNYGHSGGFDFFYAESYADARNTYDHVIKESTTDNYGSHIVRLLKITEPLVTTSMSTEQIETALDNNIDVLENTATAISQFIPPNTDRDCKPQGGANEHLSQAHYIRPMTTHNPR